MIIFTCDYCQFYYLKADSGATNISERTPQNEFSERKTLFLFAAFVVTLTGEPFRGIVWEETPEINCLNNCLEKRSAALLCSQSSTHKSLRSLIILQL